MYSQPKTGVSFVVYVFLAAILAVVAAGRWLVAKGRALVNRS